MKDFAPVNRFAEINSFTAPIMFDDRRNRVLRAQPDGTDAALERVRTARDSHGFKARRRLWPWPGMIFVLLAANVAIVSLMIYAATSDRSFSVEPDYYRKAVEWDDRVAQRERNAALGWSVQVASAAPGAPIAARLSDHDSQPIGGAQVEVVAFHNAHSSNRLQTLLEEIEPGLYRSTEVLIRSGSWELRFTVKVGGQTFTQVVPHVVQERGS